ncbi:3-isopropylmalate dehydratase small subunit [Paraburkholderia lycopersici]|uniref:3-isopropylmalate dehydratase small subunit n=1 Tax=Paraburkholderia lycopersici TaxID=416944 RepID=UPI000B815A01|nr:3-isopropylmalate dehydratase small subunit [Paraburkholderia lycopersici]
MNPFTTLKSLVVPIDRANIDTDAIIPKQFMKSIARTGFGVNLFDEWRYLDHGEPGQDVASRRLNPEFTLNQARFAGAQILLARDNFGCGSSREHAAWALYDYGIRALIAPSFADIFYGNCFKNGMLPITLDQTTIRSLFDLVERPDGLQIAIDLRSQTLEVPDLGCLRFEVDPERKRRLLAGLDDVALTLRLGDRIRAYEADRRLKEPWLFPQFDNSPEGHA